VPGWSDIAGKPLNRIGIDDTAEDTEQKPTEDVAGIHQAESFSREPSTEKR
jgi:hypothetical protein